MTVTSCHHSCLTDFINIHTTPYMCILNLCYPIVSSFKLQQACGGEHEIPIACPCTSNHVKPSSIERPTYRIAVRVFCTPEHILEAQHRWLLGCGTSAFSPWPKNKALTIKQWKNQHPPWIEVLCSYLVIETLDSLPHTVCIKQKFQYW
jgi:hypothetical protein